MGNFVSDTCEKGIKLLWFQCNKSLFFRGIEYLKQAINEDDPSAYYFLGRCYYFKDGGLKENKTKALELYKKGSSLGCPRCVFGMNNLEIPLHSIIKTIKYTAEKSLNMLIDMGNYGDGCACYQLGYIYYYDYIPKNIKNIIQDTKTEAFKWFEKGASLGHILCMKKLSDCFLNGNGTIKNITKSHYYTEKTAQCGDSEAQYKTALFYENNKEMKKAFYWYTIAEENGHINATVKIADYFNYGICVNKNQKIGFIYYSKSANNGDLYSQNVLGNCYLNGLGIEKNELKAFYWYKKASENGYIDAKANEAFCYMNGYGCKKDIETAILIFEELAEKHKNMFSCRQLCTIYKNGLELKKNILKSLKYCQNGAEFGDMWCTEELTRFKKNIFGKWIYK